MSRKRINTAKWIATATLIVGSAVNGYGIYPLGPFILMLGGFIWLAVAIKIRDYPLITTNAVMTAVTAIALMLHYLEGAAV